MLIGIILTNKKITIEDISALNWSLRFWKV